MAYGPRIDPTAYVAAERVLAAATGHRWVGRSEAQRGGWDAAGHWGICPRDVQEAWFAAGCRDGGKFRLTICLMWEAAVVNGPRSTVKKGDSLPWLRAYARGWRWLQRRHGRTSRSGATQYPALDGRVTRKAVAAIGRLSPLLRQAAILRFLDGSGPERIRIRDLDWTAVRRAQRALAAGDRHVEAALLPLNRAVEILALQVPMPDEHWYWCHSPYAERSALRTTFTAGRPWSVDLPLKILRRLVLGASPHEIAGAPFTRAEARAWLADGTPARAEWLARRRDLPFSRSLAVIDWLSRLKAEGRLVAIHTRHNLGALGLLFRGGEQAVDHLQLNDQQDAGEQLRIPERAGFPRIALIDILDEIQDVDLELERAEGRAPSALVVLGRVLERRRDGVTARQLNDRHQLAPSPAWAGSLPTRISILDTPAKLAIEGLAMDHCVGAMVDAVRARQCVLFSVRSASGTRRSTLELSPDGLHVRQHLGRSNGPAPERHKGLIAALMSRIKGGKKR